MNATTTGVAWQHDLSRYSEQQRMVLEALLNRHSAWPLVAPGPATQELDLVFDIALRAPDHGHLRPWRFVVIQGQARYALADVFEKAARSQDAQADAGRVRAKALAAPVVIALGVHITPARKVPPQEQLLAVGAAAMNMLIALQTLGYGGFWGTGAYVYDRGVKEALGFGVHEHLIGFLYAGTPKEEKKHMERSGRSSYVREWDGRVD